MNKRITRMGNSIEKIHQWKTVHWYLSTIQKSISTLLQALLFQRYTGCRQCQRLRNLVGGGRGWGNLSSKTWMIRTMVSKPSNFYHFLRAIWDNHPNTTFTQLKCRGLQAWETSLTFMQGYAVLLGTPDFDHWLSELPLVYCLWMHKNQSKLCRYNPSALILATIKWLFPFYMRFT